MKRLLSMALACAVILATSCGGSSDGEEASPTLSNGAAAIGAAFSGAGNSSVSETLALRKAIMNAIAKQALASQTCGNAGNGPNNVTTSESGEDGTYGSAVDAQELTSADFCESGTEEILFASFELSSATVTCDDGTTFEMSGEGVFTEDMGYHPKIYGTFTITEDGTESSLDCTLGLDNEVVDASVSSCTDPSNEGAEVEIATDVICTIDAN